MKRSEVNEILDHSWSFMKTHGVHLPPFAHWAPEQMRAPEATEIRARGLGWDITDYGQGRFDELGLFLFTARNGRAEDLGAGRGMLYAEKIMISRRDQLSPMHRHNIKAEDIINRGGATLVVELYGSDDAGGFAGDRGGRVWCDGIACGVVIAYVGEGNWLRRDSAGGSPQTQSPIIHVM